MFVGWLSTDSRTLASVAGQTGEDGDICFWNVSTGKITRTLAEVEIPLTSLVYLPDGKRLAVAKGQWGTSIINVESNKVDQRLEEMRGSVRDLQLSPDGKTLMALVVHSSNISFERFAVGWDLSTGKLLPRRLFLDRCNAFSFSPDGKFLTGMQRQINLLARSKRGQRPSKPYKQFVVIQFNGLFP